MVLRKFADVWVALAIVTIAACAQFNPIAQAETVQQKALAAYGSVTIGVEQIAALLAPDTLPDNVQTPLIAAAEKGGAFAKAGLKAYTEAEAATAAFKVDAAEQGRFNATMASLDSWLTKSGPVIDDLKAALRGAQH
jgi:hypothetical protein